ncbi:RNA polymerase II transcription factor SIII subunit A-domain-containing protein [Xylariales sp. PMI_506]|nr:RNA polymerase II transcription factor SIII subunit A-domain-containing protein [Xylariales sp. PMI_506]
MPVKGLVELCTAVCIKNIKEVTDIGALPYSRARPILIRIDSPIQLRAIEQASPHIELEDAECWIRLIERNFPVLRAQNDYAPRNPAMWHRIYARYAKEDAEQKALAEEKLKNAFAGIQRKKEATIKEVEVFSRSGLPRPPRDTKNIGRKAAVGRRGGNNDTGELRFTAGSRTKTTSGASVMRRVKREAAEYHARNKLATPNGALVVRRDQIKQAPKGMVHEKIVKNNPAVKIHPPAIKTRGDEYYDRVMRDREDRLRKMKGASSSGGGGANYIDDSDLEDDDGGNIFGDSTAHYSGGGGLDVDDLEDIFSEDEAESSSRYSSNSPAKSAALPGKKKGILSNAYRPAASSSSSSTVARVSARPSPSAPASRSGESAARPRPSAASYSPPLDPTSPSKPAAVSSSAAASPDLKPRMPVKRKAVDVFMRPKPKAPRW